MILLQALDLVITIALLPFFGFLALITIAAIANRWVTRHRATGIAPTQSRFLIVIPAHDEAGAIGSTVRSCLSLDYDRGLYEVYVIADNCSDSTAQEAREAGATVVERVDPELRSKGHALEYFFTQYAPGRPDAGYDAAVLIDADTVAHPDLLTEFNIALARGQNWIQGYYTVRNPDASWRTRMMTFAFSLANGVWMRGLEGMGLSVGLKGNGMCFAARALQRFPWRAYGLVEDMEFALMLRTVGERVRFLPEAVVFGEMVSKAGPGAASQRRRWEAGRRSLRGKFASPLARSAKLGPIHKILYLIDLFFPPLSTLASGLLVMAGLEWLRWPASFQSPFGIIMTCTHSAMLLTLIIYLLSPLVLMGLPARYLRSLVAVPYYLVWKLIIAAGRRPQGWVRTPRESRTETDRHDSKTFEHQG